MGGGRGAFCEWNVLIRVVATWLYIQDGAIDSRSMTSTVGKSPHNIGL